MHSNMLVWGTKGILMTSMDLHWRTSKGLIVKTGHLPSTCALPKPGSACGSCGWERMFIGRGPLAHECTCRFVQITLTSFSVQSWISKVALSL